ncbi:MAG: hypothetical protein IKK99_01130 [Oscillospiraceae bacterium]|nr:hypothetical protein [Oscillospiraceae bacterium]
MNIKKDIIIEGIIEITKQKKFSKVETKQDGKDYDLENIVVKALGDALPEGYCQKYAGSIRVTIELQSNSIAVNKGDSLNNKTEYKPVVMEEPEDVI